jgi:phage shock protein PspC (stress-responsive transcriptional regulator)
MIGDVDDDTPFNDLGATATQAPPHDPPPIGPRRLTRSTDDRMVAGVCGGVARYLGVDPTIVRVGTMLLTILGGIGIAAYIGAWLLVPEDGETVPPRRPAWKIALVIVAVLWLAGIGDVWGGDGTVLAVTLLAVGAVLVWGGDGGGRSVTGAQHRRQQVRHEPVAVVEHTGPGRWSWSPPPAAPAPPPVNRGWARAAASAVGGLLLASGAIAAAIFLSDDIEPTVLLGLALAGFGVALALGALVGGARPLLPGALLVLLALGAVAIIDVPITGGAGERGLRPATLADLPTVERLAAGQLTLDLSGVAFVGDERRVEASVAVGELVVLVPAGVTVEVDANAGIGELEILGTIDDGPSPELDRVFEAPAENAGRVELDLQVGIGRVEVRRAG